MLASSWHISSAGLLLKGDQLVVTKLNKNEQKLIDTYLTRFKKDDLVKLINFLKEAIVDSESYDQDVGLVHFTYGLF